MPIVELLGVIVPIESIYWLIFYVQVETVILCLCGYFGMKRDLWLFVLLYLSWICATTLFKIDFLQEFALIEAAAFAVIVWWLYRRPERIPSDPHSKNTAQVAFYYGDKFPLVAKIASFIGLPVSGIGIIIGDKGIMMRGKTGMLEEIDRTNFRKWIILDTNIEINGQIKGEFKNLKGKKTSKSGCMSVMTPFLSSLGDQYKPFRLQSPSSYMSQILDLRSK